MTTGRWVVAAAFAGWRQEALHLPCKSFLALELRRAEGVQSVISS